MSRPDVSSRIERPFSVINVPSKGRYYEGGKSSFLIRHLSYIEENILADKSLMKEEDGLKYVIDNLIVDDFDIEKLLPGDIQAISMFLYSTAYGDKIDIDVNCPICKTKEKKEVLISDFSMKNVESWPDENGFLSGTLPISNVSFMLKMPTFFEEFRFKNAKNNNETYLEKLTFLLYDLNGERDKDNIGEMLLNLSIMDSRFLKNMLEKSIPGVDTNIQHVCVECEQEYRVHIPSSHNFLNLPESYLSSLMEELYLVTKHGEGISWDAARHMSANQRKWLLNRIQKDIKKRNESDSAQARSMQTQSRRFKKR